MGMNQETEVTNKLSLLIRSLIVSYYILGSCSRGASETSGMTIDIGSGTKESSTT